VYVQPKKRQTVETHIEQTVDIDDMDDAFECVVE